MTETYLWAGKAPYEDGFRPFITEFPVTGTKGAVIVCPGGGYSHKAAHEGAPVARKINEASISAFVLDYRIAPCDMRAPLADAQRAIRLVRSMGYEKVAILGFSAGGHLACCAATMYEAGDPDSDDPIERISSRPDAFIPCYAVTSFAICYNSGTINSLLGDRKNDMKLTREYSPAGNVTCDTPEAFIWHTAEDMSVPVRASIDLAAALSARGVAYEMHIFTKGRHGLGLAEGVEGTSAWSELMNRWLINKGYGSI